MLDPHGGRHVVQHEAVDTQSGNLAVIVKIVKSVISKAVKGWKAGHRHSQMRRKTPQTGKSVHTVSNNKKVSVTYENTASLFVLYGSTVTVEIT